MGARSSKRGPASVPAQPQLVVTVTIAATATEDLPNAAKVDVSMSVEAPELVADMIERANAMGQFARPLDLLVEAISRALGGGSMERVTPTSSQVGRA